MNLTLLLWLADIAQGLKTGFVIIGLASLLAAGMALGAYYESQIGEEANSLKLLKIFTSILVFCGLLATLLPSRLVFYSYITETTVQEIAKQPATQRIAEKLLRVVEVKLDEILPEEKK